MSDVNERPEVDDRDEAGVEDVPGVGRDAVEFSGTEPSRGDAVESAGGSGAEEGIEFVPDDHPEDQVINEGNP